MMKLYGFANSRSLRAAWALEEVGAAYDYVKVDMAGGEGRSPQYLAINPGGKVPALVDDGFTLTESAAIVTYLGERHPQANLVPAAGSRERARYDQWSHFVIGELEQPLWTMAKHKFALPEKLRVPAINETAVWEFGNAAKVLDQGLGEQQYILGERFSGADILIAHTLAWARKFKVPIDHGRLNAYADRCLQRPALARAVQREKA